MTSSNSRMLRARSIGDSRLASSGRSALSRVTRWYERSTRSW